MVQNVFGARAEALKVPEASLKAARTELFQIEQVLPDLLKRLHGAEGNEARQLRSNAANLQLRRAEILEAIEKYEGQIKKGSPLAPEEIAAHQQAINDSLSQKVTEDRQLRIAGIIAAKKAEHEAALEGRVSAEVEAERARQIAEGRILSPEEVQERAQKPVPDDADIAVIEADAKTLEKDIVDRVTDPDEQAALKAELAELQKNIYDDEGAAVKAAFPCVGKE